MLLSSGASTVLLWQIRGGFRIICWLAGSVGVTMVALATAFKRCARASADYGALVIPAQLVLLLAWIPVRVLFLALERTAREMHRADTQLRRRWAAGVLSQAERQVR